MTIEDIIAFHEGEAERNTALATMNTEWAVHYRGSHQREAAAGRRKIATRFDRIAAAHRAAAGLLRKLSADT